MRFSISSHHRYPIELFYGVIDICNNYSVELPRKSPYIGNWGEPDEAFVEINHDNIIELRIDVVWFSVSELTYYHIDESIKLKSTTELLIIGLGPFGICCVWENHKQYSILSAQINGKSCTNQVSNLFKKNHKLYKAWYGLAKNDREKSHFYKDKYNISFIQSHHIDKEKLRFMNAMRLYTYRYKVIFEEWNIIDESWIKGKRKNQYIEYFADFVCDGIYNKIYDNSLLEYHKAAKPKKLVINWIVNKSDYIAYFFISENQISKIFEKFYGAHPDTKTDFIIRIDAEKRKYELALYRYGLKEPQIIPEDVYQLLVFKNKFEDYRSENYNQERGAWIW